MAKHSYNVVAACLIGCAMMLLSPLPSSAQSDEKALFVADLKAYHQECDKVTLSDTELLRKCKNEQAKLVNRQHQLKIADADLDLPLSTKVEFRGGMR